MGAAGRPTGRRGEQRRSRQDDFLNDATEVLIERGLRGATMDDLAERAGVAKVILYRHFPSKEDLIHDVLSRMSKRLLEVDRVPWDTHYDSSKRALVVARSDPNAFMLVVRHARFDPVFSHHYEAVHSAVSARLEVAFRRQSLDPRLCRLSAEAVTSYFLESLANWVASGPIEEDDLFLRWLAAGSMSISGARISKFQDPVAEARLGSSSAA